MNDSEKFEVIIIGGSYAGLSAAMALGRSLRNVLIIDGESPCNRFTPHSHNFITHDGEVPHLIAQKAIDQVLEYDTIKMIKDFAIHAKKTDIGFEISTKSKQSFSAEKLIFATGIKDLMLDIKGFSDCWGVSVIHCPYCHGYEFRNQKTGILSNGDSAFHLAQLVHNLTDDVVILTSEKANFSSEQQAKLRKHNIQIIENKILEIQHDNGYIKNVIFEDGSKTNFDAIYARIPFKQHSEIPESLGCEFTDTGILKVDAYQKTNISGIFACGDNSSQMRSVSYAVATGNIAGAMTNMELIDDKF